MTPVIRVTTEAILNVGYDNISCSLFLYSGPKRWTTSTWDMLGRGTDGPLAGNRLRALVSGNHF